MKAVQEYKKAISELNHLFEVFTSAIDADGLTASAIKTWSIEDVRGYANGAIRYKPNERIKEELIGDAPDKETLKRRLDYMTMELKEQPPFGDNYFPQYDTHYYSPGNIELVEALKKINSVDWAFGIAQQLGHTALWANAMIKDTFNMLAKLYQYAGISPNPLKVKQGDSDDTSPQTTPEPQQKDLHYYCQKAIEKGYLVKADGGYRRATWSKAQLAYFLKHFLNTDGTFPDKKYCEMFGESRLSKSAEQLINNKNGGGKPRGYEQIDKLLQE